MKANNGDKIKLIENVSCGTVYGLISIAEGECFTVKYRNDSDDGIIVEEVVTINGQLGKNEVPVTILDNQYIVLTDNMPEIDIDFDLSRIELIKHINEKYK